MLKHAFKEWAVVCRALAEGRQAIILRKGGVAEEGGVFRPEYDRFWLFPTFVHQQRDSIKPDALPMLDLAMRSQPPAGRLVIQTFVEVTAAFHLERIDLALALDKLHIWSPETVMNRFLYRSPGLYALAVRVQQVAEPIALPLHPEYEGCKTWVELKGQLSTTESRPVLDDRRYADFLEELDTLLHPRAFA